MIPWRETEHPRTPRGARTGGRFAPKGKRLVIPRPRTDQARVEALIREHRGFIYSRIKYYARAYGNGLVTLDDMESAALLGAIEAAKRYTPAKGSFCNWAIRHIDGMLTNELRQAQAGVIHVPRAVLQEQGFPQYESVKTTQLVTPDALTESLERAEEASDMAETRSRVKRILAVLKKHLPDRAIQVYLLMAGDGRSTREVARELGIGQSTVSRDYRQAVGIVNALKAKHLLKAQLPTKVPAGALAELRAASLRVVKLARRYARLRPYERALPAGAVTRMQARSQAVLAKWLHLDQAVADSLLNPPTVPVVENETHTKKRPA